MKRNLVKYKLIEILPRIFAVVVKDHYERAMLFCRFQEFYESPYNEIRGKFFTLEEFMSLYRKKNKTNLFYYPTDWAGYNLPSDVIYHAFDTFGLSLNSYDIILKDIVYECEKMVGNNFYLIGVDKIVSQTMDHEIAHGLYYTNKNYKLECDKLVKLIPNKTFLEIKKRLLDIGYHRSNKIIYDEIQAFLSTSKYFNTPNRNEFVLNFKKYKKDGKSNIFRH